MGKLKLKSLNDASEASGILFGMITIVVILIFKNNGICFRFRNTGMIDLFFFHVI